MEQQKVNLYDVVESMSEQNKTLSLSNAYNEAIIKNKDARIEELEKELQELRKEHIKEMDKDAE